MRIHSKTISKVAKKCIESREETHQPLRVVCLAESNNNYVVKHRSNYMVKHVVKGENWLVQPLKRGRTSPFYSSLEMIRWKTGISTKSLHRYEIGEVLPSLEVYTILCECIGGRCYSEKSDSELLFLQKFNRSDRFVRSIEKG